MNHTLTDEELFDLAPPHLPTFRRSRYTAENERRLIGDFRADDQVGIKETYQSLLELFLILRPCLADSFELRKAIETFTASRALEELLEAMRQLGMHHGFSLKETELSRTIHDLRGGAFQALSCRMELFRAGIKQDDEKSMFFLLRDHLKIMRNCIQDLDSARFAADRAKTRHDAQLLADKWAHSDFYGATAPVEVTFKCLYTGSLCESCLELSTLDRAIYNLMNNAAKHTADGRVQFFIVPAPRDIPDSVRLVFCNKVSDEHRRILQDRMGDDFSAIYQGGFTTGGHGLGMRIAADFCSHAYGLPFEKAKEQRYFGAKMISDQFVAWFHWPIGQ